MRDHTFKIIWSGVFNLLFLELSCHRLPALLPTIAPHNIIVALFFVGVQKVRGIKFLREPLKNVSDSESEFTELLLCVPRLSQQNELLQQIRENDFLFRKENGSGLGVYVAVQCRYVDHDCVQKTNSSCNSGITTLKSNSLRILSAKMV